MHKQLPLVGNWNGSRSFTTGYAIESDSGGFGK